MLLVSTPLKDDQTSSFNPALQTPVVTSLHIIFGCGILLLKCKCVEVNVNTRTSYITLKTTLSLINMNCSYAQSHFNWEITVGLFLELTTVCWVTTTACETTLGIRGTGFLSLFVDPTVEFRSTHSSCPTWMLQQNYSHYPTFTVDATVELR